MELVFHAVVRSIRSKHGNAFAALAVSVMQSLMMVAFFYVFFVILGIRSAPLRGDFLLYILSGIFVFMAHVKAVGAVAGAEGPTGAMMKHAPMNPIIGLAAAALGALYIQLLTLLLILFVYDIAYKPLEIQDPVGVFAMFVLAWATGCGVGLIFYAIKPWAPTAVGILTTIYQRANMVASGKMFLANALPPSMLVMFAWNPLFHIIDQCRGFMFRNYFPRNTNWEYAVWFGIVAVMIGLMAEFYTRRHVSNSWFARR